MLGDRWNRNLYEPVQLKEDQTLRDYEGLFLVDDAKATDNFPAVADHIKGLLQRHGAVLGKFEKWDSRRLAYDVKGRKRGTYILTKFQADPAKIAELRRDCHISTTILRAMILLEENVGIPLIEQEMAPRAPRPEPSTAGEPAAGTPPDADEVPESLDEELADAEPAGPEPPGPEPPGSEPAST